MSLWILDTDTFSLLQRQHPGVTAQALVRPTDSVTTSIVTVKEVFLGRYNKIKQAQQAEALIAAYARLEDSMNLLRRMPILSFDELAANHYVELRDAYRRLQRNDLQIAAIALSHQAILVTRNLAHFGQINDLPIEDWSK